MKSVFRLLVLALGAYGAYWYAVRPACGRGDAVACPEPALEEGVGTALSAGEVCPRSGYLCAGRGSFQVQRWPLDKGRLRVRVPLADFVDPGSARELRDAAVEGIMAWDGHPFPIVADIGQFTLHVPDIRVVWTQGLNVAAEGQMRMGGWPDGKRMHFETDGLALVVPPIAALLAQAGAAPTRDMHEALLAHVRAAAMHEMGHGLGLLHSDAKGDIMFPQMSPDPSGVQLSARDIATVEALYALPNGATVQ